MNGHDQVASPRLDLSEQAASADERCQLQECLRKLVDLVPQLKEIKEEEEVRKMLFSADTAASIQSQLEGLDLTAVASKKDKDDISDLQILQSVLDYIRDLREEVNQNA